MSIPYILTMVDNVPLRHPCLVRQRCSEYCRAPVPGEGGGGGGVGGGESANRFPGYYHRSSRSGSVPIQNMQIGRPRLAGGGRGGVETHAPQLNPFTAQG